MKGSLKNVESSFICRRCKGELCETRQINSQVNGLHIDGHEYEIVDKFCYLGDILSQEGGCEHAILKRIYRYCALQCFHRRSQSAHVLHAPYAISKVWRWACRSV